MGALTHLRPFGPDNRFDLFRFVDRFGETWFHVTDSTAVGMFDLDQIVYQERSSSVTEAEAEAAVLARIA